MIDATMQTAMSFELFNMDFLSQQGGTFPQAQEHPSRFERRKPDIRSMTDRTGDARESRRVAPILWLDVTKGGAESGRSG